VSFWSKDVRFSLFSRKNSISDSVLPLHNSYLNTAKLPSLGDENQVSQSTRRTA